MTNKSHDSDTPLKADCPSATCSPRFILEERSGIVAIYDTHHPEYKSTPGCHADYPWVVCHWKGSPVYGEHGIEYWEVEPRWTEKARRTLELLNFLENSDLTDIIPEIIEEPAKAGCAPGNETIGYLAGEISRLRSALREIHEIATRHKRASDLKTYLLADLESIERRSSPDA